MCAVTKVADASGLVTPIDKKESFTNVQIIPLPVLRYFILRPSVFGIRSFLCLRASP